MQKRPDLAMRMVVSEIKVIRRHLRPLLKAASLPNDMRLYDLRHSSATIDMMLGTSAKVVSEKLGHTNPGFTLKTYSHVKPALQRDAVRRVTTALFEQSQPVQSKEK